MNSFFKAFSLSMLFSLFIIAADLQSETAKTFAFAVFLLSTTVIVCGSNKKTKVEHLESTDMASERS